jgi:DNA-binding transcriptional MerR regulator
MKISELADKTKVPKETIHYYIREGVLPKPRKRAKNVADYGESYVEQIRIIKKLQDSYYLPLSVIKRIIKRHKKQPQSEQSSFQLLSEYFGPMDRLFYNNDVEGRDEFMKATGLSAYWLGRMEEWRVITAEMRDGVSVFSHDDVIIGKLLVEMDRTGFGPRDGYNPEELKRIVDFVREWVRGTQREYYQSNLERLASQEVTEKGSKFTEIMSLFFYHLYRKLVREEYGDMLNSSSRG